MTVITPGLINTGEITTTFLADGSVTTAKLDTDAVTTAKVLDAAITNAKIDTLDAGKITTGTLDAERIGAGTIRADQFVGASITQAHQETSLTSVNITGNFWKRVFTSSSIDFTFPGYNYGQNTRTIDLELEFFIDEGSSLLEFMFCRIYFGGTWIAEEGVDCIRVGASTYTKSFTSVRIVKPVNIGGFRNVTVDCRREGSDNRIVNGVRMNLLRMSA